MTRGGSSRRDQDSINLDPDEYVQARENLRKAWERQLELSKRMSDQARPRKLAEVDRDLTQARERVRVLEGEREYSAAWGDGKLEALEQLIDDQIREAQRECDELGI